MSENISTTTSNATDDGIGFDDIVNNNLTQAIWAQLPSGRNFSEQSNADSCHILTKNDTLALLIPGWEGIPTNIVINIFLFSILMFGFFLLIRRVYQTERLIKTEYIANESSRDWIHFIYGKRSSNQNILYTTKEINREHPNAYLPLILHQHYNLIRGMPKPNQKGIQPMLFRQSLETPIETKESKGMEVIEEKGNDLTASPKSGPMENTKDEDEEEEDEEQKAVKLKSLLWDEDIPQGVEVALKDDLDKEPPKGCVERLTKWFTKYFLIKDEDIHSKRGSDALQYLTFQRYIIFLLVFITFISLFIVLPVNLFEDRLKDRPHTQFLKTTILNIKRDSSVVYIHAFVTILIVLMGILLMKTFSEFVSKRVKNIDKKIVLIENIPKLKRNSMEIRDYFAKRFPNVVIKRITFVYDIRRLAFLLKRLWTSIEAKHYCREYERRYGNKCEIRPYCLGNFRGVLGCCLCYPKVDGHQFYTNEQKAFQRDIDMEVMVTTATPQRIAFVVFETEEMASEVFYYYRRKYCYCYSISSVFLRFCGHESDSLNSWRWYVNYAPYPDDIDWKDIATKKWKVWTLNITMNLLIVMIFIFISTPTSALNIIQFVMRSKERQKVEPNDNIPQLSYDIFWSYAPTLGYTILTGLLPQVIKILTTKIPFRTKSDYNHSIMFKTYIYLVLMVLILPSLEIMTVFALFESQFHVNGTGTAKQLEWSCLLPAENGAFFINYVLTSTFVGNALNVMRVSELSVYTLRFQLFSRNSAEYLTARQGTKFDFNFGTSYAKILLHLTLIVTFSISCPLIAPVGLFYMVVKHLVDRYLIYHVFVPSKISQRIHSKATLFVYFALLLLLMQVYTHLAAMDHTIPSIIVGTAFILHLVFTLFEFFWDFIYFL